MLAENVGRELAANKNVPDEGPQSKELMKRCRTDPDYRHVYVMTFVVIHTIIQLCGIAGLLWGIINCRFLTFFWSFLLGLLSTSIGVGIGAHRYYTHNCFKATRGARWLFILMHTLAGQNSMIKWVRIHRVHHWYSDTDADPHNSTRGFFFCHMGWLMTKPHPLARQKLRECDVSDLFKDDIVMFQYKYFYTLWFVVGFLFPVLVPYYCWNESLTLAILIAFFFRYAVSLHITWTVNSIAHLYGNKPYDKSIKPTQVSFVWLITGGEGWHNFHHTFPWDSRLSEFGQRDGFATMVLDILEKLGMIYDAKTVSPELVQRQKQNAGDGTKLSLLRPEVDRCRPEVVEDRSKTRKVSVR